MSVLSTPVALVGSKGLQVTLNSNTATYLTNDTPNAEPRYRARFYFDPNTIKMASGNAHYLFYGYSGTSTVVLRVDFRFSSSKYQLNAGLLNDSTTWKSTSWVTISDAPHFIELDWKASTTTSAKNGYLTLWIDGAQKANLTGIDNDTRRIDRVRLGAVSDIDTGTRGAYYFDAFESRRQSSIGPAASVQSSASLEPEPTLETLSEETNSLTIILSTTVQPGAANHIAGDIGGLHVNVDLPVNISSEPIVAILTSTDTHTLPDGYALVGDMFTIRLDSVNGTSVAVVEQPLTLTIDYATIVDNADQTLEVSLQAWNAEAEIWEIVLATVSAADHTITAVLNHSATLAVWQKDTAETTYLFLPAIQR